eukprot:CAMPEP_0197824138 /NCGR_PEP_ID=MMETSP1437-20131217/1438_1 /TAXON_ID=49252 ORGANISM="Eucampia antarctica, Strain CCMP1452" /NCGR_SAMPLE_ID=MMETSP1437 /ASSEMBLY_ACC=CAM_ASM_001096 /LENGTH=183 /DNA_ID=CAMNT_0043423655 /DNA_START=90 /DNA_END=638 /DNA_ORIENTATION=+
MMKCCILVNAAMLITVCLTLLAASLVSGFAPIRTVPVKTQCRTITTITIATTTVCPQGHMFMDRSNIGVSLASQKNQNDSRSDDDDDEDLDDYDFQAAFQERVKKEGGASGLKAKAAKREVDTITRDVTGSIKSKLSSEGLLSTSEWGLTVGFLALVVVLAIGTHFGSSPIPIETDSNGDELW